MNKKVIKKNLVRALVNYAHVAGYGSDNLNNLIKDFYKAYAGGNNYTNTKAIPYMRELVKEAEKYL